MKSTSHVNQNFNRLAILSRWFHPRHSHGRQRYASTGGTRS